MSAPERPESSIRAGRELARGSAWMIGMRWAIRGVGLVSTIILARLLAPDDFGVVAMAMVAVAFRHRRPGPLPALSRQTDPAAWVVMKNLLRAWTAPGEEPVPADS